jgi:hypothetical protein
MHICVFVCLYVYMCVCVLVCIYVCVDLPFNMWLLEDVLLCLYVHVCVCACMHIPVFMCVCEGHHMHLCYACTFKHMLLLIDLFYTHTYLHKIWRYISHGFYNRCNFRALRDCPEYGILFVQRMPDLINVCMCILAYVCIYVCIYKWALRDCPEYGILFVQHMTDLHVYTCTYECVYMCMYICVCINVYVYMCSCNACPT